MDKNNDRGAFNKAQVKNYILIALATALVVSGGFWVKGDFESKMVAPTGVALAPSVPTIPPARTEVSLDGSYFKGDENAPVTIVEFSDFQCPFCGRFFTQTLPQIDEQYIKTGKVKFYYKDFPLTQIHPNAVSAANAARCAGEQDRFWEFHDGLFVNNQNLGTSLYSKLASDLSLDVAKFDECISTDKYAGAIAKDQQEGASSGIRGTPGFLINGVLVSGAQPFSVFQQAIEAELAN